MLKIGSTDLFPYVGDKPITEIYQGNTLIWQLQAGHGLQDLDVWKQDLEYANIYSNDIEELSTAGTVWSSTVTDESIHSVKIRRTKITTTWSNSDKRYIDLDYIFKANKYYKVSFTVKGYIGRDLAGHYEVVEFGKNWKVSNCFYNQNFYLNDKTDGVEVNCVIYNTEESNLKLHLCSDNFSHGDWIELKDFMVKEYDTCPPAPNVEYYTTTYSGIDEDVMSLIDEDGSGYIHTNTMDNVNSGRHFSLGRNSKGTTYPVYLHRPYSKYKLTGKVARTKNADIMFNYVGYGTNSAYLDYDNTTKYITDENYMLLTRNGVPYYSGITSKFLDEEDAYVSFEVQTIPQMNCYYSNYVGTLTDGSTQLKYQFIDLRCVVYDDFAIGNKLSAFIGISLKDVKLELLPLTIIE